MKNNSLKSNNKIIELTALYEISKELGSSLDLNLTLNSIMDILANKMDMQRGTLTLFDPETKELNIEVAHGMTADEKKRGRYKIGEGITGKVLEKGEPIIVPDIGKDPLFLNKTKSRGDIRKENISFICIPVKVKGKTIGVISVDRLFKYISFEEDVRVLTIVASLIGQAVLISRIVDQEKKNLIEKNLYLQNELVSKYKWTNIIGRSKKMNEIYEIVGRVSQSKAIVLIRGESGTGKELIARAIHYNSPRSEGPFIKINCASLPETLLESELFGHEKGAFTGAISMRKGRFEMADKGTLFLDEIGDVPLTIQVKLLRVVQEMRFERLGGTNTLSVDVRIVAATNRDLEKAIKDGSFRADLYYRLNVVPIFLPSLSERMDDLPLLIEYFLDKYNSENNKYVRFSSDAIKIMMRYNWPGNIRELQNFIERVVVMAKGDIIDSGEIIGMLNFVSSPEQDRIEKEEESDTYQLKNNIEEIEKKNIISALKKCGGVQAKAAKILGITPRQIGYKINKYKI